MNLGTKATEAARALKDDRHFQQFLEGVQEVAEAWLHTAIRSMPDQRVDSTAYARALCDVWVGMKAAAEGVPQAQVRKPGIKGMINAG